MPPPEISNKPNVTVTFFCFICLITSKPVQKQQYGQVSDISAPSNDIMNYNEPLMNHNEPLLVSNDIMNH